MPNYWMFKCYPHWYRLRESLAEFPKADTWKVSRYRKRIKAGDVVYIYQSAPCAGVYARGKVRCDPCPAKDVKDAPPTGNYWTSKARQEQQDSLPAPLVLIDYDWSTCDAPVSLEQLEAHQLNKDNLPILRIPRGTNFTATKDQAEVIDELIAGARTLQPPMPDLEDNIAELLKEKVNNICEVCGIQVKLPQGLYCEAHHLWPLGGNPSGPSCEGNLIILCPNHHRQFQYGWMAIDPDTRKLRSTDGERDGQPLERGREFDAECLKHAWERYGGSAGKSRAKSAHPFSPDTERWARPVEEWDEDDWMTWDMLPQNSKAREDMAAAHLARGRTPRVRPDEDDPAE